MKKILLFFTIASWPALSQITITRSDMANTFAVGNNTQNHQDTQISAIDIGSPGGGNSWDFSMLQSDITGTVSFKLNSYPKLSSNVNGTITGNSLTLVGSLFNGTEVYTLTMISNITANNLSGTYTIKNNSGSVVESVTSSPSFGAAFLQPRTRVKAKNSIKNFCIFPFFMINQLSKRVLEIFISKHSMTRKMPLIISTKLNNRRTFKIRNKNTKFWYLIMSKTKYCTL